MCVENRHDTIQLKQQNHQETQLWLSDRAMLRVIEYFAKSLEVTQDHSK